MGTDTYPRMQTVWVEDEHGRGWTGSVKIWSDGNTNDSDLHEMSLRQSSPLGGIYAMVDSNSHGAWASIQFEGTGISERDLQWAAAWAAVEIRRKREAIGV